MSMSGTLNGVELCMLHGSWVLEKVFGEALNSMQYGPCAESTNFLGDMRDCMDSVCCELQYMGYVFSFCIDKDVDTDVNATQDIISVHM